MARRTRKEHAVLDDGWDIIVELAGVGGMVVMPVGCPVCGVDPDLGHHRPAGAPPFEVVESGSDRGDSRHLPRKAEKFRE